MIHEPTDARGGDAGHLRVRPATADDAEAICRIYNQGIEDRVATLETEVKTTEERRQWLAARGPRHPVIVAEITQPRSTHSTPPPVGASLAAPVTTQPLRTHGTPPSVQADLAAPVTTQPLRTHGTPPSVQADLAAPVTVIIGWGSLNVFNPREAYRFVADFSIYVERGARGQGVGRVMLARLVELGHAHGYHKLVLSAFPTNAAGMALYTKLGFRTVGIYKEQGRLDGRWVDTIIMEKLLEE